MYVARLSISLVEVDDRSDFGAGYRGNEEKEDLREIQARSAFTFRK